MRYRETADDPYPKLVIEDDRIFMPRYIDLPLRIIVLALCTTTLGCAANSSIGSLTTISSSNIVLPELGNFELFTRDSSGIHPILSRMARECDGKQCGAYAGESGGAGLMARTWKALPPFFLLEVLDDELVVQPGQFPGLKQTLKADAEGFRANAAAGLAELPFNINIVSPEGSELVFVDASANASDEFFESEIHLAIAAHGMIKYKRRNGSIVSHRFDAMIGFVLVKDKVLVTSLIAPTEGPAWTRRTFENLAQLLAKENS